MASSPAVFGLLEEMLDSGRTPEEVCRDCPELLAAVRQQWKEFCLIDAEVGALLPEPGALPPPTIITRMPAGKVRPDADAVAPVPLTAGLPQVPGYEVEAVLGRGGMGVVYKARQVRLNRIVALKMIRSATHAGREERLRFLAEAEAVAAVKHPGIVQVFDFGTHDEQPYFSMEFCEGGSLADRLADNLLSPPEAAQLVEQVARAVQAAHQAGIVHRDLKPGNVLLQRGFTADGEGEAPAEPREGEASALHDFGGI